MSENQTYYETAGSVLIKFMCNEKVAILPQGITAIGAKSFEPAYSTKLRQLQIPTSVVAICEKGLAGLPVEELYLPDNVILLGSGAFESCAQMISVQLPARIKVLPNRLFLGCQSLKTIIVPQEVEVIQSHAFSGCKNLKEIYLPKRIQRIEPFAFVGCDSLERVVFSGTPQMDICQSYGVKGKTVETDNSEYIAKMLSGEEAHQYWFAHSRNIRSFSDLIKNL